MSENIEVISIIDRFLEHARVMIFCNDGNEQIFITSADWMPRNLDNRVEVGVPVFDPGVRKQLREVIDIQLSGSAKARIIDSRQSNRYRYEYMKDKTHIRSQTETYKHFVKTMQKAFVVHDTSVI
jgi:polyphosphate kinase